MYGRVVINWGSRRSGHDIPNGNGVRAHGYWKASHLVGKQHDKTKISCAAVAPPQQRRVRNLACAHGAPHLHTWSRIVSRLSDCTCMLPRGLNVLVEIALMNSSSALARSAPTVCFDSPVSCVLLHMHATSDIKPWRDNLAQLQRPQSSCSRKSSAAKSLIR